MIPKTPQPRKPRLLGSASLLTLSLLVFPESAWARPPLGCPEAERAWERGEIEVSTSLAQACLDKRPADPLAQLAMAHALGSQKRYAEALDWANQAHERLPKNLDIALWRIRLYLWSGEPQRAWMELEKIPSSAWRFADNLRLRGDIAFARGDHEAAIRSYDALIAKRPDDPIALNNRGLSHRALGNEELARSNFQRSCELAGAGSDGCLLLQRQGCPSADQRYFEGRAVEAEQEARACLEKSKDDPQVWLSLARALAVNQKLPESMEWTNRALAERPEDPEILLWKARLLSWKGQARESWDLLHALPDAFFEDPDNLRLRANVNFDLKHYEAAAQDYALWTARRPPGDMVAWNNRGLSLRALGREDEASQAFSRACELGGPTSDGCELAGKLGCPSAAALWRQGVHDTAETLARSCLERNPEDTRTWMVLARTLGSQGKFDESLDWISRARARSQEGAPRQEIDVYRAKVLQWSGDIEGSWAVLQTLPESAFKDTETRRLRANLAFQRMDYEQAIQDYDLYIADRPTDAVAINNRGLSHDALGHKELARQDYEHACIQGGEGSAGCKLLERQRRDAARYRVFLQPGYQAVLDRPDGTSLYGLGSVKLTKTLLLGLSADYRARDYGVGRLYDTTLAASADYRHASGGTLSGQLAVTPSPDFSPVWAVWVEPGWNFSNGLEASLRLWRMNFEFGGATLLSPMLNWNVGAFSLYGRYYLAFDDELGPASSGVAKVTWFPAEDFWLYLGGGLGQRSDYLDVRLTSSDGFWLALTGLGKDFGIWSLHLDYLLRRENIDPLATETSPNTDPIYWTEHDLYLGVGRRF